ncbi:hypothetical protein AYI69_g2252 [Smittium culicis]|uniref:Uncharacterized protein n=1 Tax=Smittium culicis TaxID=133412 RepID=A0A1R1YN02_9FUNG|nr:hypothetical protein AYI69_g2252 [Smittium culicis]
MNFTGNPQQLIESEGISSMGSEKFKALLASRGFRRKISGEIEKDNNGLEILSCWRAPLGVQAILGKAHGKSMVRNIVDKGLQIPIKKL